jgi:ABC-type transport system involved in multi-copper enzyme maturation permease subunit
LSPLGPVFFYDLVRSARRERAMLFRCLYGLVLLVVLCWVYGSWMAEQGNRGSWFEEGSAAAGELSRFARQFFETFIAVQYLAVVVLTPVYAAGAVAEEKERGTLDYLLATDLSDREIVLGKLASRLGNLGLLVLTGLPVLGLVQLWGGVDPSLVLAGFAATLATMLSLGSLSLLNSVLKKRPVDALWSTYLQVGAFLLAGGCIPVNVGHPVVALVWLSGHYGNGPEQDAVLALVAGGYVVIHLFMAVVFTIAAVRRVRSAALGPPQQPLPRRPSGAPVVLGGGTAARYGPPAVRLVRAYPGPPPPPPRPRVGANALLWKELYGGQEFRWDSLHPLVAVAVVFVGVIAATVGLILVLLWFSSGGTFTAEAINAWVQVVGTAIACALFLAIGVFAAGTVSRERERQTLDSLLTVPEDRATILGAKWLGSFLCVRGAYWTLGVVWALGLFTGGLHVLGCLLTATAFVVYAAFVTSLGVYCSTISKTTLRATLATVVGLLATVGVPWLLAGTARDVLTPYLSTEALEWVVAFQDYGLAAPTPLVVLAFPSVVYLGLPDWATLEKIMGALAGLGVYALAALVLWRLALARFRAIS